MIRLRQWQRLSDKSKTAAAASVAAEGGSNCQLKLRRLYFCREISLLLCSTALVDVVGAVLLDKAECGSGVRIGFIGLMHFAPSLRSRGHRVCDFDVGTQAGI